MTQRVYWHIGLPKTGTTYLQKAIWTHKAALGKRGLLVPGRGHRQHLLATLEVREDPKLERRPAGGVHPWQALVREANASSKNVLLTHEFFAGASEEQIRRAVADLTGEVHVVLTARSMVDLGISRWQEFVKNGGAKAIDDYPGPASYKPSNEWGWSSFDLADILTRWSAVIEPKRIHVLPLAPGRPANELWERFLGVVGVDPEGLAAPDEPANTSLGVVEIELLRRVTAQLPDFKSAVDRGQWLRGFLGEGGVLPASNEKFRPSHARIAHLEALNTDALRLLDSADFDLVGERDWLTSRDVSERRHPGDVTDTELLEAAVATIAELTREVRRRTER